MTQESFYSERLKAVVKRISKTAAEKMFNQGKTIYFQSSNMMFDNVWQPAFPMNKDSESAKWIAGGNFITICNYFHYYYCDSERGKYIKFYYIEKN